MLAHFMHLHDRPLTVHVYPRDADIGCEVLATTDQYSPADVHVTDSPWQDAGDYETIQLSKDIHRGPGIHFGGMSLGIHTSCAPVEKQICRGSCYE